MRSFLVGVFLAVPAASFFAQSTEPPYAFATLAGRAASSGTTDGAAASARFNRPWGVAVDAAGNLYVTESVNHTLRRIAPDGTVSTVAGQAGVTGFVDGPGATALFGGVSSSPANATGPYGLALDGSGAAIVADSHYHRLRRVSLERVVSTFAGGGASGALDAPLAVASFSFPLAVASDAAGNLYIADTYNHVIRRITRAGVLSTIAGSAGNFGSADGVESQARFLHPSAIAVSPTGIVFVADSANTIRRLSPNAITPGAWEVSTLAGAPLTFGRTDGTGAAARFGSAPVPGSTPTSRTVSYSTVSPPSGVSVAFAEVSYRLGDISGLAADAAGNVFVADFSNNTIRKITAAGVVTTIGGSTTSGSSDGVGTAARFNGPCGLAVDAAGTLFIADLANHTIRVGMLAAAPAVQAQSGNQTVAVGANVALSVTATGGPLPTIQWSRNGTAITGATSSTLLLPNVQLAQAGTYTAALTSVTGTAFIVPIVLNVTAAPAITVQPASQTVGGAERISLSVTAVGFPTPTYQWVRNGAPLAGATGASLTIVNAQEESAGDYHVVVTNALGSVTSSSATVVVNSGRLVNLSIRSALTGAEPLIAGFVVAGGAKSLLIRAIGPGLRQFGVGAAMADPQLSLHVRGAVTATNDNWSSSASANAIATTAARGGGFPLTVGSLDAAALATISNDAVTAQASARDSAGGVVLLELYDAGSLTVARLVNVSARAQVGVGENALFAGFAVGGTSARTLLIRAIGPTLGAFGVSGALPDPVLEVFAAGAASPRSSNDNWNGDAGLVAAFARVGAFALPAASSKDAALVATFEPGAYSARVSGFGNTTGEVLLEIYVLP